MILQDRAYFAHIKWLKEGKNFSVDGYEQGYTQGAKDQRKIDIDKALKYWHKILDSQGINQIVFQDFKKAMEE